jgi:hypothetical protein
MLTAAFFAEQRDIISTMVENDLSYISIVIMSLYVIVSGYIGRLCYLADKLTKEKDREKLLKRMDVGWFAGEHFFSLGLLGTLIGLTIATSTSLTAEAQVSIVAGLKVGLNTAFYTTICGIVCSLPLQVQLIILKQELE